QVAGARWTTEQCYAEGKGEAGLADYEVRYWHSWHRHVTLSMMAHAWLASLRRAERERGAGEKGVARVGCLREAAAIAGRGERGRSATALGGCPAAASLLPRVGAGVVRLAARQAPTGTSQPLPTTGRFLVAH